LIRRGRGAGSGNCLGDVGDGLALGILGGEHLALGLAVEEFEARARAVLELAQELREARGRFIARSDRGDHAPVGRGHHAGAGEDQHRGHKGQRSSPKAFRVHQLERIRPVRRPVSGRAQFLLRVPYASGSGTLILQATGH
jgi:hypothetical protein